MNLSTYTFGQFDKGYTQYPLDCNSELLQHCVKLSKQDRQLIIFRKERLMFYTFVMFLSSKHNSYIGICLSFNDLMVTHFDDFYQMFMESIESLAIEGEILTYDADCITYKCSALENKTTEIMGLEKYINAKMEQITLSPKSLLPIQYGLANDSVKYCPLNIGAETICNFASRYAFTVVSDATNMVEELSDVEHILYPNGKRMKKEKDSLIGNIKEYIWNLLK